LFYQLYKHTDSNISKDQETESNDVNNLDINNSIYKLCTFNHEANIPILSSYQLYKHTDSNISTSQEVDLSDLKNIDLNSIYKLYISYQLSKYVHSVILPTIENVTIPIGTFLRNKKQNLTNPDNIDLNSIYKLYVFIMMTQIDGFHRSTNSINI